MTTSAELRRARASTCPEGQGAGTPAEPPSATALIALDVDGTALTPVHTVTSALRGAVHRAQALGVRVVLSSSRSAEGLRPVAVELGLEHEWFSAFQGALLARWTPTGLETLQRSALDAQVARATWSSALALGLSPSLYTAEEWSVAEIDRAIARAAAITGETPSVRGVEELEVLPAPLKLMVIAQRKEQLGDLTELADSLPPEALGVFSHENYLEVTAASAHKGAGLRGIADHYGIPTSRCAAIGDGLNDLAAFEVAGVSIAMAHAPLAVRQAAHLVTGSNAEDGAANAIGSLLDAWVIPPTRVDSPTDTKEQRT